MKIRILYMFVLLTVLFSCGYEFPENDISDSYTIGSLNFEKFIALGDDFSAGVMNGALYTDGQNNSIPSILANQINEVQELSFTQPDIHSENGRNYYVEPNPEIFGRWKYIFTDKISDKPKIKLTIGEGVSANEIEFSTLSNLSIPFLKVPQLFSTELIRNPYYERIAGKETQEVPFENIVKSKPTFFYLWLGMNDILNYAINGADKNTPGIFSETDFTSVSEFESNLDDLIDILLQNSECKGVIGNIISITDLPYFYYHPYNFLLLENSEIAAAKAAIQLNKFNNGVIFHNRTASEENKRPLMGFEDNGITNLYPQPLIIEDESLPDAFYPDGSPIPKYRQLVDGEIALYSITDEMVAAGYGHQIALPDKYVLTKKEIEIIENVINEYNKAILQTVEQHSDRLVLADVAGSVHEISSTGTYDAWGQVKNDTIYYANGIPIEGTLNLNSIFSLDALHFNNRGNAFIANIFIDAVNKEFSVFIPKADINGYEGNTFTVLY